MNTGGPGVALVLIHYRLYSEFSVLNFLALLLRKFINKLTVSSCMSSSSERVSGNFEEYHLCMVGER